MLERLFSQTQNPTSENNLIRLLSFSTGWSKLSFSKTRRYHPSFSRGPVIISQSSSLQQNPRRNEWAAFTTVTSVLTNERADGRTDPRKQTNAASLPSVRITSPVHNQYTSMFLMVRWCVRVWNRRRQGRIFFRKKSWLTYFRSNQEFLSTLTLQLRQGAATFSPPFLILFNHQVFLFYLELLTFFHSSEDTVLCIIIFCLASHRFPLGRDSFV